MKGQVVAEQDESGKAQALKLLRNISVVHILKQESHLRLQTSAAAGEKLGSNRSGLFVLFNADSKHAAKLLDSSFDQHTVT